MWLGIDNIKLAIKENEKFDIGVSKELVDNFSQHKSINRKITKLVSLHSDLYKMLEKRETVWKPDYNLEDIKKMESTLKKTHNDFVWNVDGRIKDLSKELERAINIHKHDTRYYTKEEMDAVIKKVGDFDNRISEIKDLVLKVLTK